MPDGGGRLLNQRTGHSAPPSRVRYYGNQGDVILSAGQDSTLHSFSTLHESKNRSLGRASYNKKQSKKSGLKLDKYMMPPVTAFTAGDLPGLAKCNILYCMINLLYFNIFVFILQSLDYIIFM